MKHADTFLVTTELNDLATSVSAVCVWHAVYFSQLPSLQVSVQLRTQVSMILVSACKYSLTRTNPMSLTHFVEKQILSFALQ